MPDGADKGRQVPYDWQHGSRPHRPRLAPDERVPTPATILLVDDQPFVRHTLHLLLAEQPHWKIYEAENGKVALDRVREIHPDVVILDIVMPEMNGMQAAFFFQLRLF